MPRFAGASANAVIQKNNNSASNNEKQRNDSLLRAKDEREKRDAMRRSRVLPHQNEIKQFYDHRSSQLFWAAMILLNFLISAVNAQILPGEDDKITLAIFNACENFFAYAFLWELIINFYGGFFWEFWQSAWNIFDFLIVGVSLLSLYMTNLPGISVLRLFRAFRVVRLFKRIKTMRKMMDSIMRSLPGMWMAFCALFLIMGIYGIIGVNFWRDSYPEYYGSFLKAILSLLQIMSFDSWCSGIAREIIFDSGVIAAIYFISYVFIASIVMANVLVALLLDEFMSQDDELDNELMEEELERTWGESKAKVELATNVTATGNPPMTNPPSSPGGDSESGMILLGNIVVEEQGTISRSERNDVNNVPPYVFDSINQDIKFSDSSHWQKRKLLPGQRKEVGGGRQAIQKNTSLELSPPDSLEWKSRVEQHIGALTQRTSRLNSQVDKMNAKLDLFLHKVSDILTGHFERQQPTEMNQLAYSPNEVRRRYPEAIRPGSGQFRPASTHLRLEII